MLWTTCIICLIGFRRQLNLHTEWFLFVQEQNSKNIICPMTLECSTRLADITRLRIGGGLCDIGDVGLSPYVVHQILGRTEIRHWPCDLSPITEASESIFSNPFFYFSTVLDGSAIQGECLKLHHELLYRHSLSGAPLGCDRKWCIFVFMFPSLWVFLSLTP